MATVKEALQMARSLLNDDLGTKWPDTILLPKLQIAHQQMQSALALNSIPVTKTQSTVITVAALATDLGIYQPTDLVEPISMQERDVGGSADDFVDMREVSFIPTLEQDTNLIYWAWLGERIKLLGATIAKEVTLRYTKSLTTPQTVNESIGVVGGETYLGYKVASLIDPVWAIEAKNELDDLVRTNVKGMQGICHRRQGYRSRGRRCLGGV